jgi:hypothetical protein
VVMWAALKWVADQAVSVIKWAYWHPVAAVAVGIGLALAAEAVKEELPWLASVVESAAGVVVAGAVAGAATQALLDPLKKLKKKTLSKVEAFGGWLYDFVVPPKELWWFLYPWVE